MAYNVRVFITSSLFITFIFASQHDDHQRAIADIYNSSDEINEEDSSAWDQGINSIVSISNSEVDCSYSTGCTSPWHYCANGTCTCGPTPVHDMLQCKIGKNLSLFSTYCITFHQLSTYIGSCPYNHGNVDKQIQIILPNAEHELEAFMCDKLFKRTGILCGKCKDGYYPLAYSFDMNCVECPKQHYNWWKLVLAAFLPLTIFYFIVVLFKINATSSHLHGFVFCCQGIAMPAMARVILISTLHQKKVQNSVRYFGSVYGIWNLDILRFFDLHICLGTDMIQTLALDLAVGIYPLLLMMLSYLLIHLHDRNFKPLVMVWKPFKGVFSLFRR